MRRLDGDDHALSNARGHATKRDIVQARAPLHAARAPGGAAGAPAPRG